MKPTTAIFDDEQGQAVRIPEFVGLDAAGIPDDFLSPEERNQGASPGTTGTLPDLDRRPST